MKGKEIIKAIVIRVAAVIAGLILALSVLLSVYFFHTLARSYRFYEFIKTPYKGWEGNMHQADSILGYKPRPNAKGYETDGNGRKIEMKYDSNGFRVPAQGAKRDTSKRPRMLFLGCSFTFGSMCLAEETFPFIVEKSLDGYTINAGAVSYGFSQMLILARRFIPEYKPDYVVLQYSPWLAERAVSMLRPTVYGELPMPYFTLKDGKNKVIPPPFITNILDLPISKYKKTDKSFSDFISFLTHVAFPLFVYDDFHLSLMKIKLLLGILPPPNKAYEHLNEDMLSEVYALCRENGSKLVIVFIGQSGVSKTFMDKIRFRDDLIVVDAQEALWDHLKDKTTKGYNRAYKHWSRGGKKLIDRHPNPAAHKIIAEAIVKAIKEKNEMALEKALFLRHMQDQGK